MAFAPHTNNDVRGQLRAGVTPSPDPLIFGCFRVGEGRNPPLFFEYAERRWPDDNFAPEMPHIIYTAGGARLALVRKTVAYVVTDEDANGPVVEKWQIKSHREYPTDWVRP